MDNRFTGNAVSPVHPCRAIKSQIADGRRDQPLRFVIVELELRPIAERQAVTRARRSRPEPDVDISAHGQIRVEIDSKRRLARACGIYVAFGAAVVVQIELHDQIVNGARRDDNLAGNPRVGSFPIPNRSGVGNQLKGFGINLGHGQDRRHIFERHDRPIGMPPYPGFAIPDDQPRPQLNGTSGMIEPAEGDGELRSRRPIQRHAAVGHDIAGSLKLDVGGLMWPKRSRHRADDRWIGGHQTIGPQHRPDHG